jgi:hypothetical protein
MTKYLLEGIKMLALIGAIALVVWTMPESETPFSQAAAQGASTVK